MAIAITGLDRGRERDMSSDGGGGREACYALSPLKPNDFVPDYITIQKKKKKTCAQFSAIKLFHTYHLFG